jgi:hypothetical protein
MVAVLFLLALFSFALMGLFLVGLTLYSGLASRARIVDEAADGLGSACAARQALLADATRLAPEGAGSPDAVHVAGRSERAAGQREIVGLAQLDAEVRRQLAHLLSSAALHAVPDQMLAELRRRLQWTDADVSGAVRRYNVVVTEFNQARSLVPAAFVARIAGLAERPLIGDPHNLPDAAAVQVLDRRV